MGVAGVASESWGIMGRSEDVLRRTFRKQMCKNNEPSAASLRRVNRRQVPVKNNGGLGTIPLILKAMNRFDKLLDDLVKKFLPRYSSKDMNRMKDPPGGPSGRLAV